MVTLHWNEWCESNDSEQSAAELAIVQVLAWQWDAIAEPVLTALGYRATPSSREHERTDDDAEWPRVWWCPVGVAAGLPLRAAGHHGDPADPADRPGGRRTVLDARVLSSPTRAEARDALPKHRIAHFACHGHADRERPRQSRLILADHDTAPLTVADLVQLEFNADLAYLSACSTSVTAPQLADEALHLTGAFHLLGYHQVIGTLWPVDDHTAADLAADVYTQLAEDGLNTKRAAEALHHAVRALRAKRPASPSLWAPYTHTGA